MRSYLLAVVVFFSFSAIAQNIVPNSNFALHDTCPDAQAQIARCKFWTQPAYGTPDYFHACSPNVSFGVPSNGLGNQTSVDNAYVGGASYTFAGIGGEVSRELIATVIPALQVGATYRVTLVTSLGDVCRYATDGLGMFFYKDFVTDYADNLYSVSPQVDFSSFGIIRDTANWVTLTKTFVADSAYTHLVVGALKPAALMQIDSFSDPTLFDFAYYYFDSVAVEKIMPALVKWDESAASVNFSPNPIKDHSVFTLGSSWQLPCQLRVFDISGALVREVNDITSNEVRIDRGDLNSGLYFYEVSGRDNSMARGKLMIE